MALLQQIKPAGSIGSDMDDTTSDNLDQAHEDILTYTVSDEALEAEAGTEIISIGLPTGCRLWIYDSVADRARNWFGLP
jgi:hypothetical protein